MSNFTFGHKVFKNRLLLLCQNASAGGKGLTVKKDAATSKMHVHIRWGYSVLHVFSNLYSRNQIKNGIWPTNLWNLGAMVLVLSVLLIMDWEFARPVTSRLLYMETFFYIAQGMFQNWGTFNCVDNFLHKYLKFSHLTLN